MTTITVTTNGTSEAFPPVVLDTTLNELLLSDQPPNEPVETLCLLKPNSDRRHGNVVPLSDKYIIHSAQVDDSDDLAHLQLENCCHLLMFFAGAMNVMFVASEGNSKDPMLSQKNVDSNARRSFGIIEEKRRPKIQTHANMEDCINNYDGAKIRWGFAMDFAERLPHLLHPELIYKLNSKRWLGICPLKSANDLVLDCKIQCPTHQTEDGLWYYGGDDCSECIEGVKKEEQRITQILKETPSPFVLKLTQSLSAVGTNIVQTEDEKSDLIDKIAEYLHAYLPRITAENAHLHTTALVLSDFIKGETMALNFHVRRDGNPVYLGACHQLATGESGRQATAITYATQERLEMKYRPIVEKIADVLHDEGYWGPVGADVMEDPDTGTLFAIDLNVRTPLSLLLFLLKTHFNDHHGLGMSLVYECVMLGIPREELEKRFSKEFAEARIVLLGSTRLGDKDLWAYGMVIAGEGKDEIDKLSDRILEFEAKGQEVDG